MKRVIYIILSILVLVLFVSCNKQEPVKEPTNEKTVPVKTETEGKTPVPTVNPNPTVEEPCEHVASDWIYPEGWKCEDEVLAYKECIKCHEKLEEEMVFIDHVYKEKRIEPTCTDDGAIITYCANCEYYQRKTIAALGHKKGDYVITVEATPTTPGTKTAYCERCNTVLDEIKYVNNGYLAYGKLHVDGQYLTGEHDERVQLYGLSYHGLQWFNRFVNKDTIVALQNEFGINVLRLACYSSEGGYAEGGNYMKQIYKNCIDTAITVGSEIGLYIVVDWHMVGAENVNDKNPLYYMEDAKEFFSYVSSKYKDYDNVIYEIMNEPCGDTTWADCKEYANTIIPIIRENTDAVILVGNPHWTSDLRSVIKDPLDFDNIMYTYHFYADDIKSSSEVVNAFSKGLPIFISEYGFMGSSGDGAMNYDTGYAWIKDLDDRNISYIAWNISNSRGSASILKNTVYALADFSDKNLKEWGICLKEMYRKKAGLDE